MSTKFTCRFCNEQFDVPKGLYKHLQLVHNAGVSRDSRTCPICGVLCSKYESYRDHLLYIHGQTDDGQKLAFKSLNELLVWKAELELKHNCKYVLQTSPKVLPTKEKKYFYKCDGSNSKSKDKKSSMSVIMKTCSSVISVVEGAGSFKVEYWDTHSGHSEPPVASLQNELEAAISSVEMVNAIADSDDSFDKSEELFIPEITSPSISNIEKPTLFIKTNSPANINKSPVVNTFLKTKTIQSLGKLDSVKKKSSMSFSLASVACGKGIVKKPAVKSNENKSADSQSALKPDSKNASENSITNSASSAVKQKEDPASKEPVTANKPDEPTVTTSSSTSVTTKTTSSGPAAIAPKIPPVTNNTINPLFSANNAFSNQFVIMSPASVGQNSLTSSPNVFTAGQNILFSLGPVGQNSPLTSTTQTVTPISATEAKKASFVNKTKGETFSKRNASKISTPAKNSLTNTQAVSSVMTSTITSNSAVTLSPGMSNAPVILSSLPVGSTFMSVNNNFIPIASPSGAYIPNNLPPNIVLTPVVPGSSLSKLNSSKTTTSSLNTVTITPVPKKKASASNTKGEISTSKVSTSSKNIQTQVRFTAPSTVAITVSSIVKEPLYTSSTIKHMSNIVTSSASPIVSTASKNSMQKSQNKFVPITTASRVSPVKSIDKTFNSPKGSSNASKSKNSPYSIDDKAETNSAPSAKKSTSKANTHAANKSVSDASSATDMYSSTPKSKTSARKRMTKSVKVKASPIITSGNNFLSPFNTNVVNSRLHLKPISSTPNVTIATQLSAQKPGTMLFESSAGEIYMLEPLENEEISTGSKKVPVAETPKIKIDRSVQTTENSSLAILRSKLQRKRAAPPTDDSAVMLKVKCYQLEMKCLNSQAQCKRLKVELTKERLRNAELSGKKASENLDYETLNESINTNATEIMKEIEDRFSETKEPSIYTMTKTSVLRSLYEDLEEVCVENGQLCKELENYRAHDKFYKSLKKRLHDEEF